MFPLARKHFSKQWVLGKREREVFSFLSDAKYSLLFLMRSIRSLPRARRCHTATAAEPVELCMLPRVDFEEIVATRCALPRSR